MNAPDELLLPTVSNATEEVPCGCTSSIDNALSEDNFESLQGLPEAGPTTLCTTESSSELYGKSELCVGCFALSGAAVSSVTAETIDLQGIDTEVRTITELACTVSEVLEMNSCKAKQTKFTVYCHHFFKFP